LPVSLHSPEHRALMTVIAACRREAGLTQEQFGKACGYNQAWASKIETGERGIQVSEFMLIASVLKMDPRVLFDRYMAFLPKADQPPSRIVQLAGTPTHAAPLRSRAKSKRKKR
jgi:transcriptional regulator with XRE-family HTH domain